MKTILYFILLIYFYSQAQIPPINSYLVDSPFPAVHNGSYRQGYTDLPGLRKGDELEITIAETPKNRISPWALYSEKYPNGEYTIWGSTSTHIFKAIITKAEFKVVSDYRIDRDPRMNDLSWTMLLLSGNRILTCDDNIFYLFGEEDPTNPRSKIVLLKKITMPKKIKILAKLCRLYDGSIAFASKDGLIGIVDGEDFSLKATYQIPLSRKEKAYHNDYAVDENGNFFISTTRKMLSVQWNGKELSSNWEVYMEFGGNKFQGIGTTPTLLGTGNDDKLVCVVDSQKPARMLTFWRDEIPEDWVGIPGEDRRLASAFKLPNTKPANWFMAAVENSPTAYGYEIACAQYNGFIRQSCNTKKGVYKLKWDTDNNEMNLLWHRKDINLNNVLIYSTASNAIYGSGREEDCNFYYYVIDWDSGKTIEKFLLGSDKKFDDPGDANIIGPDRSIIYNTKKGIIRLQPKE